MKTLMDYMVEVVAAAWVALVAVQYISSYYIPLGVDFTWAYLVMAAITTISVITRLIGNRRRT